MKNDGREIHIPFPNEKYNRYLQKIGVAYEKQPTPTQVKELLITIISDFLSGDLSLDEFSSICGSLWSDLNHEEKFTEFGQFLMGISDLRYYVRHPTNNAVEEIIIRVINYYDKNKKD
jgi:hypothetical protein